MVDTLHELKCCGVDLHVKFTGRGEKKSFDKKMKYAVLKGVLHNLEFTGFVEECELHRLMRGALALLAPLPETLKSESRFSTKLGYYLASGSPVVTNAVGDVGLYLQDGVNAFVAPKCNSHQIATQIELIINNPNHAEAVSGITGMRKLWDEMVKK